MENQSQPQIEPVAKVLAATGISQSLSFCMERKYLQDIDKGDFFSLAINPSSNESSVSWIAIEQVGRPLEDSSENCFSAIQKILYSCFLPKEIQLVFLVLGNKKENHLYLGLRKPGSANPPKSLIRNLNEFIKGIWPGLETTIVDEKEGKKHFDALNHFKSKIAQNDDGLEYIYALTGIPSMESQYKTLYPATIDKLIAGMNKSNDYAFFVVADPIESQDTEEMLYQCREMNGQAESLKSINITEGITQGTSHQVTDSWSKTHQEGSNESITKKDFSKLGKAALAATGLGTAASIFPAAGAVLEGCSNATGVIVQAAVNVIGGATIGNFITNLMPQKTTSTSVSDSETEGSSESYGTNESKSQSLSRNIVNKHIESVSEHLFFHSQRIEQGKAIGLWKVGVYLAANKKSDLESGSLQLRSILSGHESIFEPIRIHDITNIMDKEEENHKPLRANTIGSFNSPSIGINTVQSKPFAHPLGKQYNELKTVLTTKELSYLINFPLRSVPGISVVDSSPEFSLNQPETEDGITFGKLLYGGSLTNMEYKIPVESLSRHALLSGINGSGKTNTIQAILNGINNLPFLVIEPAKTEYVDWALEYNEQNPNNPINIYIPGCVNYKSKFKPKPLKLNPFEIVWLDEKQDPNVLTHIDRLKSTFAAAFPMYDILPVLMEDLIYTIYQNKSTDWLNEKPVFGKTIAPTLNSMKVSVDKVIENHQYEERVSRNMKACLNTRIDSLLRGWKKDMLNTIESTPWNELFEKPTVINLSYVGDDVDKGFFMSLILQFLYEYRSALAEANSFNYNDSGCKHLTVIEEAHRVMSKCDKQDLPQYKTAMMFSNMLSEIRAYGEGFLLVDQVPTRLIPDAIKNTNLKITHRLVAEDDCKAIGESMGLNKEQRMVIPKLLTGQCIVSSSLSTDIYWIKTNKVK